MSQLLASRYTVAVTAAASSEATPVGTMHVGLQLGVQHPTAAPAAAALTGHEGPVSVPLPPMEPAADKRGRETVAVDLTIPLFYQLLTTLEEARAGLRAAGDQ